MTIEVGSKAPEFTLKNQDGVEVTLSSLRGSGDVLLVFYPLAFSGICTGELCEVRDDLSAFGGSDVQVVGISVDSPHALKAWAKQEGFTFPLLSDFWPHGAVAKQYGVFLEPAGFAGRGTFLIDTGGVVRFAEHNGPGDARDQQGWKKAVAALRS